MLDIGGFYFIADRYFTDFPDDKLMRNKEHIGGQNHNRPCYYAFSDHPTGLFWLIPISSQIEKFRQVHDSKVSKYGRCDTIHFAHVLGEIRAFLIQNMCPVTEEYIIHRYVDASTDSPVRMNAKPAAEIEKKAKKVLVLHRQGKSLIFPNVLEIERQLIAK